MKKIIILFSILLLILQVGCSAQIPAAQDSLALAQAGATQPAGSAAPPRTISVTGNAEVLVVPDEVDLTLGVESSDMRLLTAKSKNDEVVTQVLTITQDLGIDAKYVKTDYISIEPRYDNSYKQPTFLGFWVRKNIVITLKDITKYEDLLGRCLEAGVNYVQGIEFRTSELRKYRDQARALAVKAAQEKAAAMAKELGQTIGQPLSIHEDYNRWYSPWNSWWGGGYSSGMAQNTIQNAPSATAPQESDSQLAPGQIAVDASVTVDFELKSTSP
jgi:uncharacterized protein YggE